MKLKGLIILFILTTLCGGALLLFTKKEARPIETEVTTREVVEAERKVLNRYRNDQFGIEVQYPGDNVRPSFLPSDKGYVLTLSTEGRTLLAVSFLREKPAYLGEVRRSHEIIVGGDSLKAERYTRSAAIEGGAVLSFERAGKHYLIEWATGEDDLVSTVISSWIWLD